MPRSGKTTTPDGVPTLLDDVFPALANPVRRRILQLLLAGPHSVNNLAAHFDMARPSVSEHLKVLRDAGLVTERRVGRERHYSLCRAPLEEISNWLHPYEVYWQDRLRLLRDTVVEEEADQAGR
ncbi:ArsR/SmtB family transcription factor [Nonomuraea ferruginea]|uniref:Metalloregulator ArsR/SmtB family transcription factor n=1 Tax=Nonomuraea ferruginea TaxID=46174 RepID=A0ABT4T4A4_9ACTN|nr:metalloregulator ArsR/SmtB family transcription factor [Nonomuraea ferruginea]MDA0643826.1 metalloregulator ArsR/SmtB family transcription factor [Nonomuraea ferruginea]